MITVRFYMVMTEQALRPMPQGFYSVYSAFSGVRSAHFLAILNPESPPFTVVLLPYRSQACTSASR